MKVLFLTHFHKLFGANRSLLTLLIALKAKGVEPLVLIQKKGDLSEALIKEGIAIHILPYFNQAYSRYTSVAYWLFGLKNILNQSALKQLRHIAKAQKVDLIYANSSQVAIGAELAEELNLPHIWHIREFGEEDYSFYFHKGRAYFLRLLNKSAHIIAISKAIKLKYQPEVQQEISTIYNGIFNESDLEKIKSQHFENCSVFKFIIIGLIHPTKGQLAALKAFKIASKNNPNIHLNIVGQGRRAYLFRLKAYARFYGLNVSFVNYVPNPLEVIAQHHCLLMCSEFEALGRVTLEGMACGLAVIGKNQGGTPELIEDYKSGLLYQSTSELAIKMAEVSNDLNLCKILGKNARAFALNNFKSDMYAEKIFQTIKQNVRIY